MTHFKKLVLILAILAFVFSSSVQETATAAPPKAGKLKFITIPMAAFAGSSNDNGVAEYLNFGFAAGSVSGDVLFNHWVKLPPGAIVKVIKMFAVDDNDAVDAQACVIGYYYSLKDSVGDGTSFEGVCTDDDSLPGEIQVVKITLSQKVSRKKALVIFVKIQEPGTLVTGVKVGYLK